MSVKDLILNRKKTAFSFEILPPLKGNGIESVYSTIDLLREFNPQYINITLLLPRRRCPARRVRRDLRVQGTWT